MQQGKTSKERLEDAYAGYIDRVPGSEQKFYNEVLDLAKRKMYHLEIENPMLGTAGTVDDYAQDVAIAVWNGLGSFRGDRSKVYAWVESIIFRTRPEFLEEIIEQRKMKVGITTIVDDEGEPEEIDNPEIYRAAEGVDLDIRIPDSVQGVDLLICKLLMTSVRGENGEYRGRTYANIAMLMEMSEDAVKKRVNRLRDRLKVEKKAEQKERQRIKEASETERRTSFKIGLAKVRAGER